MKPVDKSPDAFRTISEVAAELDLPQHVLRFWETRFTQIKPLKRGGGRRYYRPDDVDLLAGIRKLLYGEGYTIKGVQRLLKENGIHWVMDVGRGLESGAPGASQQDDDDGVEDDAYLEEDVPEQPALPMARATQTAVRVPEHGSHVAQGELPAQALRRAPTIVPADEPLPRDVLADDARVEPQRSSFSLMERLRGDARGDAETGLGKDDVRRLQATLFELLECKRILDQAR
ncbi:MerR family transcriptional regulator [Breoghania sp.]|uniref:MerR family transcriptional regulator n=1 Tax=Breoghania sp. TaxID=2065378 RepID=UPI002AAC2639|nr:MerR family transcriptional regulator [Breoghania sp.]